ncbi:MAG: hypothetical protein IPM54_10275 [Polyangiaceae bacterium]|nr:hypothetical protein [Polyangiaceae bacterium]
MSPVSWLKASDWKGKVDVGIITIRADENDAVCRRFPKKIGIVNARRQYNLHCVNPIAPHGYTVAILRCAEQGNGEALTAARDLLDDLAPRWLLVVGIAGGAPGHGFTLGDVVVSTHIIDFSVEAVLQDGSREYAVAGGRLAADASALAANVESLEAELGPWNTQEAIMLPQPPVELERENFYGDPEWQAKVTNSLEKYFKPADPNRQPKVKAAAIASSDRLVKNTEQVQVWLKVARQFVAIEMESAGVYRAAYSTRPPTPFLAIRGISDIVGFKRDERWTAYACHAAASFAVSLLRAELIPPADSPPIGSAVNREESRHRMIVSLVAICAIAGVLIGFFAFGGVDIVKILVLAALWLAVSVTIRIFAPTTSHRWLRAVKWGAPTFCFGMIAGAIFKDSHKPTEVVLNPQPPPALGSSELAPTIIGPTTTQSTEFPVDAATSPPADASSSVPSPRAIPSDAKCACNLWREHAALDWRQIFGDESKTCTAEFGKACRDKFRACCKENACWGKLALVRPYEDLDIKWNETCPRPDAGVQQ